MITLINVILPIFLAAGVVALSQRWLKLDTGTLSRASFHLFLPPLVFESLLNADLSKPEFGKIAFASVLVTLVLWGLGVLAARLLHLERETRGVFLIALVLINAGNYGFPAVSFAFGDVGMPPATVFMLVNTMIVSTLGIYLVAQGKATARMALRRLFKVPVLYACVLGVVINLIGLSVPEPCLKAIHLLSQAAVPASLAVLGLQLQQGFKRGWQLTQVRALVVVILMRLVVSPWLAVWASRWIGLQGLAGDVFVLDCALPSAVLITTLAGEFEADTSFATLSVMATTLASLLSVTLWLNWLF